MARVNIIILGCGPAGLLAAHAAHQARHNFTIHSRKEKSKIPGSQYLHEPIPGLTDLYPENTVQYIRLGTSEGYAQKVYGDSSRPTGWENYAQTYPSWNVIQAYDRLWGRYSNRIVSEEISVKSLGELIRVSDPDLVISTIPAPALCMRPMSHTFAGPKFWIKTMPTPPLDIGRDICIYNGYLADPWYRWSILGGRCSFEYTQAVDGAIEGRKAVETDCDCMTDVVVRAGRWAEWKHGVLLNHAYQKAKKAIQERE